MQVTVQWGANIEESFRVKNLVAEDWIDWILLGLGHDQAEFDTWTKQRKARTYLRFLKRISREYKTNGVRAKALADAEATVPDGDEDFEV